MQPTISVQYVFTLVVLMSFSLVSSPARSEISGTYKGAFSSQHKNVSAELRCDPNQVCEVEWAETTDGAVVPMMPLTKWPLRPLGGCSSPPQNEWGNCNVVDWDAVRKALNFARDHRNEQPIAEVREMLKALLESKAGVQNCYHLERESVICELDQSPWEKPALLLFSRMFQPCYPPSGFCTYRLMPLFKMSNTATLRAKSSGFVHERWGGPPASQAKVADYVRDLQNRIRRALIVPPGAPSDARVAYQIQFDQVTGHVFSVNFMDPQYGCFCPSLRSAVAAAVQKIQPLPLLPIDQQSILGNQSGRVYLETTVGTEN